VKKLARLVYDGSHQVGEDLARALIEAATQSVGAHHGESYRLQVRYACEDIDLLRRRLRALESDIEQRLAQHGAAVADHDRRHWAANRRLHYGRGR
jgi:phage shock protein A